MTETTEVLVQKVEVKTGTSDAGRDWTKYGLYDGNGDTYGTFDGTLGKKAQDATGQRATITWEQDGKFRNLTGLETAAPEPTLGDGSYVKGKENPSTQRSIFASVALQQAITTFERFPLASNPKAVSEQVLPLVGAYFNELLRLSGLMTDEDIPF